LRPNADRIAAACGERIDRSHCASARRRFRRSPTSAGARNRT